MTWLLKAEAASGYRRGPREASPEAEEEGTGLLAHLVVWDDVGKCIADVPEMLQHRVPLLTLAHQDGIGVHLRSHSSPICSASRLGRDS